MGVAGAEGRHGGDCVQRESPLRRGPVSQSTPVRRDSGDQTVRRMVLAVAAVAVALSSSSSIDRLWLRQLAPMKSEKRRVLAGPDSPDDAMRWVMLGMRDEFGNIPP